MILASLNSLNCGCVAVVEYAFNVVFIKLSHLFNGNLVCVSQKLSAC